jgi:arginine repressor
MKNRRQSLILDLIEAGSVTSQEQLRCQLKEQGIEVTQARCPATSATLAS